MSITTYAELQTAVQNWMNRSDTKTTDRIPEFIDMGESTLNRSPGLVPLMSMVTTDLTYATSDTTRTITYPTNLLSLHSVKIKPAGNPDNEFRTPPQRSYENMYICSPGYPAAFTILGNSLYFDRAADQSYTVRIHYRAKWDIATDLTNWLLTNHPDVYLYSALVSAEPFIRNDKRITIWKAQLKEAIEDLRLISHRSKERSEADVSHFPSSHRGYNILTD